MITVTRILHAVVSGWGLALLVMAALFACALIERGFMTVLQ